MTSEERHATPTRRTAWIIGATATLAAVVVVSVIVLLLGSQSLPEWIPSIDGQSEMDATPLSEAPKPDASGDPVADEPRELVYVEGDVGFPSTLNPLLTESVAEESAASLLFRGLLRTGPDGDPVPDLAGDWSVSEDGLRYHVEIDSAAEWHDGEPVTSADVLFTLNLITDPDFPGDASVSRFWRAIEAERIDDRTVEFRLMEPYVGFPNYLRFPVLPHHRLGATLPGDLATIDFLNDPDDVIGSSEYTLDEIDLDNRELHFARRNDDGPDGSFTRIVFRYFDTRQDVFQAFNDGEIDGVSYVPLEALEGDRVIERDARIYGPSLSSYTALFFNVRHPHLRTPEVRRALEHAIDREALIEQVLGGHAIPGSSPIPHMHSAHAPGSHATYNPSRARGILEEHGWSVVDESGILARDEEYFSFSLIVNNEDQQRVAVAEVIRDQLSMVGILVDVMPMPSADLEQALNRRQYAAALVGWHTDNGNPDCYQMWHSAQAEEGTNFTGFSSSEADELLVGARQSIRIEERNEYYAAFQEVFAEHAPAVVLFYPRYHFAVSTDIEGAAPIPLVSPGDRVRQITEWYHDSRAATSGGVAAREGNELAHVQRGAVNRLGLQRPVGYNHSQ